MSVRERYRRALAAGTLEHDPAQVAAVEAFEDLHERLVADAARRAAPRARPARLLGRHPAPAAGLYVHGGVGTGKTRLLDLFHDALPLEAKLRLHFHRFMRLVHERLGRHGDVAAPLERVAGDLAARARVLCLDEMQVGDITDAMLMHGLLRGLFGRGVTLVTTSNVPPDELYAGGLQRERFLPAIALLREHARALELDGGIDWRQRRLRDAPTWHVPHGPEADARLAGVFERAAAARRCQPEGMRVNARPLRAVAWTDGVAWFDFRPLCRGARSSEDYLEIARRFPTVLLRRVPVLDAADDDAARRFIELVDTLYDRNVRLFASAAAAPEAIYTGGRLAFEFRRAASRLREMQTGDYLSRPHRA